MENLHAPTEETRNEKRNPAPADAGRHPVVSLWGRLIAGGILAGIALFFFMKLADEVMENETLRFDTAVIQYFQQHSNGPVHALMTGVTWVGSGPVQTTVVIAVTLLFLWKRRFWPDGVAMLLAGLGGMLLDNLLKQLFHRQRPEPLFYHLGYSFPSGHSFFAVVVYGMIAYWLARDAPVRRRIWIWSIAIFAMLLVGFSRIYLGQHYPTDVLGGYTAGLFWLWGCLALPTFWDQRADHNSSAQPETGPGQSDETRASDG